MKKIDHADKLMQGEQNHDALNGNWSFVRRTHLGSLSLIILLSESNYNQFRYSKPIHCGHRAFLASFYQIFLLCVRTISYCFCSHSILAPYI